MHACVISTHIGEVIGGYMLNYGNAHAMIGETDYTVKDDFTFINGD